MKVFVLGTGGWGIALAMLLHQNGHEVTSWTYLQEECDLLHRERCNEKLLPGGKAEQRVAYEVSAAAAHPLP